MSTPQTPDPALWLDAELARLGLSQNELSKKSGLSQSSISLYRTGKAGAAICITLAQVLRKDVRLLLAIQGHMPMPAVWELEGSEIAEVWTGLSKTNQTALLRFARYLMSHEQKTQFQED